MIIEDAELRDLFRVECEEHLHTLDAGLLHLEKVPGDSATLEEMFRAAHSLKGTARMLGVSGVERIAHHMEDELDQVRRGRATLGAAHLDRYSLGLGAMQRLVEEAVIGTPALVDVDFVVGQVTGQIALETSAISEVVPSFEELQLSKTRLKAGAVPAFTGVEVVAEFTPAFEQEQPPPLATISEIVVSIPEVAPIAGIPIEIATTASRVAHADATLVRVEDLAGGITPPLPGSSEMTPPLPGSSEMTPPLPGSSEAPRASDEFKIQTMRVAPAKLDALMTLASELAVTSTRVIRAMTTLEEMGALSEEWSRELAPHRLAREIAGATRDDLARILAEFGARDHARLVRLQGLLELQGSAQGDLTRLGLLSGELEEGIRNVRLLPLSGVFGLFPRLVRDLARELGKEIDFRVEGGDLAADKRILEDIKDPLMHMIRNAIDHGIAPPDERQRAGKPRAASLCLRASRSANSIVIELQDDGRGLDVAAIKRTALARGLNSEAELEAMTPAQLHLLIFAPGFSTSPLITDLSGRGVGMDVVRTNIERLKGTIRVQSEPGQGTTFSIRLPTTLATTRVLLVGVAGRTFAIPIEWIQTILRIEPAQIFSLESRPTTVFEGRALPLAHLDSLLELAGSPKANATGITVVLENGDARLGVQVEELIEEQEVMLKPLGALLKRIRNVSGVTILGAGEICPVLSVEDLIQSASRLRSAPREVASPLEAGEKPARKTILLAEDSITTRTQEKRILEGAGFEVVTAVDGAEALAKLQTRDFDGLVSDIEMPQMDGLTLAARIRENPRWNEMPIILVTSLASDEDKRRGAEVGANAYITKGTFEQKVLVDTVRRLV